MQLAAHMVASLQAGTRVACGYASVEQISGAGQQPKLTDIMDSFFLSETCKYLFESWVAPNSSPPQKVCGLCVK